MVPGERGRQVLAPVLNDLKQRGVQDILIACVDGLKGFPEAIEAVFPHTWVQTCIVHLIRHSLRYVPRREREQVARDLRPIYTAVDADAAERRSSSSTSAGASGSRRSPRAGTTPGNRSSLSSRSPPRSGA